MRRLLAQIIFIFLFSTPALAWQQRVAYKIDVSLDTVKHSLQATQHLRYWNNSPDTLRFAWFHLYPNAFRDLTTSLARDAERFHDYRGHSIAARDRGWIDVKSIGSGNQDLSLTYGDDATSAKAELPAPLAPHDSIDFNIQFQVQLPKIIARLGHEDAHYEITQWYPKIAVYDEKGWHPDGYHYLGEFYGDFGTFTVAITTPREMKVGATGLRVADPDSAQSPMVDSTRRLFRAEEVHDFAWCADATYLDTTEVHHGVAIRVLTLPRHRKNWTGVMQYAKDALDYYGRWYGPYPYPSLTVCDGSAAAAGSMEYPNLVIIASGGDPFTRILELAVVHEIGHQWFYGVLGNNEMDEAWLDEGINTFSEERYLEEKYGPKGNVFSKSLLQHLLPEFTERYLGRMVYSMSAGNQMEQPVLTRSSEFREPMAYMVAAYKKPAIMMWWLRGDLGDSTFDSAMRTYYRKFQWRHVTSEGFFGIVDSVAHKDVRATCLPWLSTTERCDYAIRSITRIKERSNTYRVQLNRNERLVFPVSLRIDDQAGRPFTVNWSGAGPDTTFLVQTGAKLSQAVLDPSDRLPEVNRFNNHWPRQISFTLFPRLPSFDQYQISWFPFPLYDAVNGLRLGPYIHGGYMMDGGPMLGRHQWTVWPKWCFKSKELNYGLHYQTPVTRRPMPPRLYLSLRSSFDLESASLGVRRNWGEFLMSPNHRFDLHLDYDRVRDVHRFWDPRDIEEGWDLILTAERSATHSGYPVSSNLRIASAVGLRTEPGQASGDFLRAEIEERLLLRLGRMFRPQVRALVGQIAGPAPAQEQYFLSGGFKTAGLADMIVSYKGGWSAQGHYHVDGGANLPGYLGRHLRGKMVSAVDLGLPIPHVPLELFGGAGQVVNDWSEYKLKDLAADAGITLNLGGLRLIVPLWINRPSRGEKRLDWRWLVSLGGPVTTGS